MSALIAAALDLARQGFPTFSCGSDKRPVVAGGFKAATADPDEVRRLISRRGAALIGVPTGERSGLAVLDLDTVDEARAWWRAHHHRLPETRAHRTRSGGLHLLFAWPGGRVLTTAGKLAPGVDTRGDGGYIIWWPAHGGAVVRDMPLDALPPFPGWLLDLILPPRLVVQHPPAPPPVISDRYTAAALRRAIAAVATAAEGTRNDTLNSETHGLARLVGPALTARDIAVSMLAAAAAAGLPPREAQLTVSSALRARGVA